MELFFYISNFFLFSIIQALFINGLYMAMETGNILSFIKDELSMGELVDEKVKYKYASFIRKSVGMACIKCCASTYGPLTFIPTFVYVYGWNLELIPLVIFNIGCLIFLNFSFYKSV